MVSTVIVRNNSILNRLYKATAQKADAAALLLDHQQVVIAAAAANNTRGLG